MSKVATQEVLALDVPRPRIGSVGDLADAWNEKFLGQSLTVELLPHIPLTDRSVPMEVVQLHTKESTHILSRAAGLMVVNHVNGIILELDRSNLLHMQQAAAADMPVFMQVPFEEVVPKGTARPPAEIICVGDQINTVKDRLGVS